MKKYYYVHYKDTTGYAVYQMGEDGISTFVLSYKEPEEATRLADILTSWAEDEF